MKTKKLIIGILLFIAILLVATNSKGFYFNLDITGDSNFLNLNDQIQLKAIYTEANDIVIPGEPNNGLWSTQEDVTDQCIWTSNNSQVATVDEHGLVTARSLGTTVITADYKDGLRTAEYIITVIGEPEGVELVSISFPDVNMYNAMLRSLASKITNKIDDTHTIKMTAENINSVTSLYIYECDIENITGIENFPNIKVLDLAYNKIKDISKLSQLTELERLYLDGNCIGDLSPVANIEYVACKYQTIEIVEKVKKEIDLPKIFIDAQNSENRLYASEFIKLYNCTLSEDGTKIILNDDVKVATITLVGVQANSSIFVVKTEDPHLEIDEIRTIKFEYKNMYKAMTSEISKYIISKNDEENEITIKQKDIERITYLMLYNYSITNLSGIENFVNLESLDVSTNEIENLTCLKDLYKLTYLYVDYNKINNIEQIMSLTNLESLELSYNNLNDINYIDTLKYIKNLYISMNQISDISPLNNLVYLEKINIAGNKISDISPLERNNLYDRNINLSRQKLEYVNINEIDLPQIFISAKNEQSKGYTTEEFSFVNCRISEDGTKIIVTDNTKFAFLRINGGQLDKSRVIIKPAQDQQVIEFTDENLYNALKEILADKILESNDEYKILVMTQENINTVTRLEITDKSIKELAGIEYFKNLEELILSNNEIEYTDELMNLNNLKVLNISNNKLWVPGLGYLKGLTQLDMSSQRGTSIFWDGIENLYKLENLKRLNISNNDLKYITPLEDLKELEELDISNNSIEDISVLAGLEKLTNISAENQKIVYYVSNSDNRTTALPQIFVAAMQEGAYYSQSGLEFSKCVLSEDNTKVKCGKRNYKNKRRKTCRININN